MIEITPNANEHLSSIVSSSKDCEGVLLSVRGGGCAGFSYEWSLLEDANNKEEYEKISLTTGTLFIDPLAVMYVLGSVVDYSKDVFGAILKIENPNAQSKCGCGESFSV
jgi:iron-sulfur cluster assembly accessory protein|tara:strand:+ start:1094 stop:1420 length:327 start_codon:yes stop_codon:yes gene_type:complete